MAKTYWNVSPRSVLNTFRAAAPCSCHRDCLYTPPTYNVRTRTTSSYIYGKGPLIRSICVECTTCGKERETNVEYDSVYENDFKPY